MTSQLPETFNSSSVFDLISFVQQTIRNCFYQCFRCFAALGDVSKARYLHETNMIAEEAAKTMVSFNLISAI
jgi:hypothetical protein